MDKNWQVMPPAPTDFFEKYPEINNLVLQLLFNRGLKDQNEIDDFLDPNYDHQILDPFLFVQMTKAVDRIFLAVKNREKVMVYGDYDADGVCATLILYQTLKSLGLEADTYIPFRETEGYGLNPEITKQIISQGFQLVITVDCGVSNVAEIEMFSGAGVEVVVLDHHQEPLVLPRALAIINPSLADSGYPFKRLCGAGVAFKFVQALMLSQEEKNSPIKLPFGFDKWLLDLAALATVADIMPLLGENRVLVKYGLVVLEKTRRPGLKKMIESVNNFSGKMDTTYLGWRLVPRINAAGRIDHASVAFNMLNSKSEEEAEKYVGILENNNSERQQITQNILKAAEAQIGEVADQKIIIVSGESWPAGIVGLVAGRLADKYHRPVLIVGQEGDKFTGSGRSIEEFDITENLKKCEEFLARFGGHSQACGFTAMGQENFEKFKEKMTALAEDKLKEIDLRPRLWLEAKINLKDITWELWEEFNKFEPFGEANVKPILAVFGVRVEQVQPVGKDGKHLRILASEENHPNVHKFIGFSFGEWCARLKVGDKIDVAFELDVNEWNGNRELQLKIVDLKISE